MVRSHFSSDESPVSVDILTNLLVATTDFGQAIRFSSPMPWVLAIVLSVGLWTVLGLSIWWLINRI
jgi:hypothetical protein